jgi:hypothetical protein
LKKVRITTLLAVLLIITWSCTSPGMDLVSGNDAGGTVTVSHDDSLQPPDTDRDAPVVSQATGKSTDVSQGRVDQMTLVVFSVYNPHLGPHDQVFISGSLIGNNPESHPAEVKADPASWPAWKAAIELPAGSTFKYRYSIKKDKNTWFENGPVRKITVPIGSDIYRVHDDWHL